MPTGPGAWRCSGEGRGQGQEGSQWVKRSGWATSLEAENAISVLGKTAKEKGERRGAGTD